MFLYSLCHVVYIYDVSSWHRYISFPSTPDSHCKDVICSLSYLACMFYVPRDTARKQMAVGKEGYYVQSTEGDSTHLSSKPGYDVFRTAPRSATVFTIDNADSNNRLLYPSHIAFHDCKIPVSMFSCGRGADDRSFEDACGLTLCGITYLTDAVLYTVKGCSEYTSFGTLPTPWLYAICSLPLPDSKRERGNVTCKDGLWFRCDRCMCHRPPATLGTFTRPTPCSLEECALVWLWADRTLTLCGSFAHASEETRRSDKTLSRAPSGNRKKGLLGNQKGTAKSKIQIKNSLAGPSQACTGDVFFYSYEQI
jgi:hypothetical protein